MLLVLGSFVICCVACATLGLIVLACVPGLRLTFLNLLLFVVGAFLGALTFLLGYLGIFAGHELKDAAFVGQVWVSRLVNPVVSLDFYQISNRGRKLPHGSEEFMSFLQNYIARWAGRAGIL
jgi:hypothetical protein